MAGSSRFRGGGVNAIKVVATSRAEGLVVLLDPLRILM